ncbi:MAG: hypothetical protein Q8Q90_03205 [bacterium]|nr:hypothetical protein [bacterium]
MAKKIKDPECPWTKEDWRRAGRSFRRLLRINGEEFKRLANARTYRTLYLEDGIEPPC